MTITSETTKIQNHPHISHALTLLADHEIRLIAGGAGWRGTFAVLVQSVAEDLLTDGEPFTASVITEGTGPAKDSVVAYTGLVAQAADFELVFIDGTTVDVNDVLAITV